MLNPTESERWRQEFRRLIGQGDSQDIPFARRIDITRIGSRFFRRRSRRDRRRLQVYLNKAMKFLPIYRADIFDDEDAAQENIAGNWSFTENRGRSRYQISEITLDLRPRESQLCIREKDSTDLHEWIITDELCTRRSKRQDGQVYREKQIVGLPRNHEFQIGLLTRFYWCTSVLEFDSFVLRIAEYEKIPEALQHHRMFIRKLKLVVPSPWLCLPLHVENFLDKISRTELTEVHLECSGTALEEIVQLEVFRNVELHASVTTSFNAILDGWVPKKLILRCQDLSMTTKRLHMIVEKYCIPMRFGDIFIAEMQETVAEQLDIFEVLDEFLQKGEGWSFVTFDNQIAVSKDQGGGAEVLVHYCPELKQWTVENGPTKSQKAIMPFTLPEQVDIISRMTHKERMKLRESLFWEPLVYYRYESISVNFDDPEVKLNGCALPSIDCAFDAKVALTDLLKNPKSTVKKFKVTGDYFLFSTIPKIQASEVWIQGDKEFNVLFFDPFKNVHLEKLVVSTKKILDYAKHMILAADRFVVLDELNEQARKMEESDDEEETEESNSKTNDLQPEPEAEPEIEVESEPELDDSDINYESIELNFEEPEFKLNGETLPDIDSSYDVYKKMSNLALEQMVIRKLEITGQYPLFQNVRKFKTLELWLVNYGVYPASFFEPLNGNRLKKLTVSSRMIVKEATELVARAKEFIVLEDIADGQKNEQVETNDDEPKAKRAKLDWLVLNESTSEHNSDDDGEPKKKRRKLTFQRSLSRASAPSRSVSPGIRFPSPEPDRRGQSPSSGFGFGNDFEMEWALSESIRMSGKKEPEKEELKKPPVHHLSKNFVPQPLFPIPLHGFPSTSNSSHWFTDYDPMNHYNLSRYEESKTGPGKPQYPARPTTPTEPYVPITPFNMKKYEDEFHQLQIHKDRPVRKVTPVDTSGDTDDDDQPGPSES